MVFDKRASLLAMTETAENTWEWVESKTLWVNVQRKPNLNLFSKVGIGAKTVLFTLRKTEGITLHHALAVNGRHYFLTDIQDVDPIRWEIIAADIGPVPCFASSPISVLDEYKRRKFDEGKTSMTAFPAVLTEKYIRFEQAAAYEQKEPMERITAVFVLVTPKVIFLESGSLVNVNGISYTVRISHTLDEYKNEYEIARKDDV